MSLQFIFGNSGSGKSHFILEKIIEESRKNPAGSYMVIVPEQFTMQTQKDLVMMHPDHGIMNIDVLSFRRLAHRIFEEVGADRRTVLTETGKNLMLRKVAIEQKENLQVLGSRMNRPGYVSEVKSILSELMQYEITDDDIEEMMEFVKNRPLLYTKLSDIRLLYRAFTEYQRERFMKPEELLDVLCQVAGRSKLLKNSVLAFDGFVGFTPAQMNVLEELFAICPKIWMTATIDIRENFFGAAQEYELFAVSKKMIKNVSDAAMRAAGRSKFRKEEPEVEGTGEEDRLSSVVKGGPAGEEEGKLAGAREEMIEEPVILGKEGLPRFEKAEALYHLEQNLFRKKRRAFQGEPKEISMHVLPNPAEEVHFAARTISRLVREEGYRYHEIAVITGNMGAYDHYVKKIFPMYEVPAFLDETRHILLNPCLEFIRGALQVAEKDFSYESIFRFLRTGMAGLGYDEIDRLENYVLAAGIRGHSMWEKEWTYLPGRMEPEELVCCNEYRIKALENILPFAKKMREKGKPLVYYADALYELLRDCMVQQQLKDREMALMQEGSREEAREYSQIYSILIALLDEMVDLLGEEEVSGQEFAEILDAGFADARVGMIPPGIDQVQVGDIERSRLAHVKVLFFLGLNDGWVPARGDGGGIVSDMEREILTETGIELAPSARENSYIQRFYLYQNLTKPSSHLYLSWCASSGDGTAMRPSYLVSAIEKLFPKITVVKEKESGTAVGQITSKKNGMLYFTKEMSRVREGKASADWIELYATYLRDEDYRDRVQELLRAAFIRGLHGQLTYETSKELYGEVMTNSVTRLEQFASCAFAHFAMYGLHLTERETYGVKAADLGVIFHRAMELFSRQLMGRGQKWDEIDGKEKISLMEECVDTVSREYGAGILHDNARQEYTIRRIKRILCRTIWALDEQLKAGDFQPTGFEVTFADAGDLESVNVKFGEQGKLRLQGRVDRIDTASEEDVIYVKIIDYKSGSTKFDPVSLYYGLQLQLVVYLNAALEMERKLHKEKEVVPAGIFYYHFDDPILEKDGDLQEKEMQQKLLRKLRPDGILNSDEHILKMLDRNLGSDSLVIPAGMKKDGTLKAASSAVTTEQFRQLSSFVSGKMEKMAGQILDGVIEARPFADKTKCACDYCAYTDVCGFDKKIPGMCPNRAENLSKSEVWERICREAEDNAQKTEVKLQ